MSFEFKNDGATYQRLMTKIFKPLIGQTVEVYIDDILVESETRVECPAPRKSILSDMGIQHKAQSS